MERLPYIDEHAIAVAADPATTWSALLRVVCRDNASTPPTGFATDVVDPPRQLALKGRHPFSTYRLVFELAPRQSDNTELRAVTWAAFPGPHGRVYRALVIGTGVHRVVVRRWLKRIAAAAESEGAGLGQRNCP